MLIICILAAPLYIFKAIFDVIPTEINVVLANCFFTGIFLLLPHGIITSIKQIKDRKANDLNPCNRFFYSSIIVIFLILMPLNTYGIYKMYDLL